MSNERKEPTISGIRPEQDEIATHQRARPHTGAAKSVGSNQAQPQSTSARSPSPPSARSTLPPSARPVVVKSKLAPFALLLAITGLGLAGFAYWQLMQMQQVMATAEVRIAELEGKLELSDDESNASMTTMQAKLKWADSEIRKLWGVSYDTNPKAIEANTNTIATVKKTASGIDNKIKNALKNTTVEIKLINDLMEAQQASMVDIERNTKGYGNSIRQLNDQLAQLKKMEAEITRRVGSNEEAIKAIDAFRRSVNQQLLQLRAPSP